MKTREDKVEENMLRSVSKKMADGRRKFGYLNFVRQFEDLSLLNYFIAELLLFHFPIDNSLSVIKRSAILAKGPFIKGIDSQVKEWLKVYQAKLLKIGKYHTLT